MTENEILPTSVDAIAARLRATREAMELRQSEFADRAGIPRNTYNQYESGNGRPSIDFANRLCDAYGLTMDWIYRGNPSQLPFELATKLTSRAS